MSEEHKVTDRRSAFPEHSHSGDGYVEIYGGMTLIEYYAGQAMQGMLACGVLFEESGRTQAVNVAHWAFVMAEEMCREIERRGKTECH
jgi:hypothetical protein